MSNVMLYLTTVFIWGTTWIAITFQLGPADPVVSVAYRYIVAATLLVFWCRWKGKSLLFSPADHLFLALQGAVLFGFNYWLFYLCESFIPSGLAAVLFSTIMLMNVANGALFLKSPVRLPVLFGGIIGLLGITLVFAPEFSGFSLENKTAKGVLYGVGATWLASTGNILSARNQKRGLPVMETNAIGMGYGALLMTGMALFTGKSFVFPVTLPYALSLMYLAVFGSILAFGCYLTLVGNIGADRAGYASLLFPVVALLLSTLFEGYRWTPSAITGVGLILLGNFVMMQGKRERASNEPRDVVLSSRTGT